MCKLFPHHSSPLNVNLMEYLKGKRKKEGKKKWTEEKIKRRKEQKKEGKEARRKKERKEKERKMKEKNTKKPEEWREEKGKREKKEKKKENKEEKSEEKTGKKGKRKEKAPKKKPPHWHPTPTSRLVSSCHHHSHPSPPAIVRTLPWRTSCHRQDLALAYEPLELRLATLVVASSAMCPSLAPTLDEAPGPITNN